MMILRWQGSTQFSDPNILWLISPHFFPFHIPTRVAEQIHIFFSTNWITIFFRPMDLHPTATRASRGLQHLPWIAYLPTGFGRGQGIFRHQAVQKERTTLANVSAIQGYLSQAMKTSPIPSGTGLSQSMEHTLFSSMILPAILPSCHPSGSFLAAFQDTVRIFADQNWVPPSHLVVYKNHNVLGKTKTSV